MLTANKVKNILSKIARAARAEGTYTVDDVQFRLRVVSKGESDLIDARRVEALEALEQDGEGLSSHLTEVVTSLKRDTLAYAIIAVDDESLDEPFVELEDGQKVDKYLFMTEYFLPALTLSCFDSLHSYYMDLFHESDQRAGRKVEIVNTDMETEISILKARLSTLEAALPTVANTDDAAEVAPEVSRDEARELVFKPVVRAEPVHEEAPASQEESLDADPAKTIIAPRPHEQYNQQELDESERLFREREERRKAFKESEQTVRAPLPDTDDYLLEPMPRPRLTPQNLNQPPRGGSNPHFRNPKT